MNVMDLHVLGKMNKALPIEDIMAWLIAEYPDAELPQILSLLNALYQEEEYHIEPASVTKNIYNVGDREINAYPQRIEMKSE